MPAQPIKAEPIMLNNLKLLRLIIRLNGRLGKTFRELQKIWENPSTKEIDIKMKFSVGTLLQTLALAIQGLTQVNDLVPGKYKIWVVIAISGLQGVVGVLQHFSNPDGSSSREPNQGVK